MKVYIESTIYLAESMGKMVCLFDLIIAEGKVETSNKKRKPGLYTRLPLSL